MGILFYYVLSRGYSPIQVISEMLPTGNSYNFKRNLKNLLALNTSSEILLVMDLIYKMTNLDRKNRPYAEELLVHPYFWTDHENVQFIIDISKHLEKNTIQTKYLEKELNSDSKYNFDMNWMPKVDKVLMEDMLKHRKYQNTTVSLVRAIRNKVNIIYLK